MLVYMKMLTYVLHQVITGEYWLRRYYDEPMRSRIRNRMTLDQHPWFAPSKASNFVKHSTSVGVVFSSITVVVLLPTTIFYFFNAESLSGWFWFFGSPVALGVCAALYVALTYSELEDQKACSKNALWQPTEDAKINKAAMSVMLMVRKNQFDLETVKSWVESITTSNQGFVFISALSRSTWDLLKPHIDLYSVEHYRIFLPLARYVEVNLPRREDEAGFRWLLFLWADVAAVEAEMFDEKSIDAGSKMTGGTVKYFVDTYPQLVTRIMSRCLLKMGYEHVNEFVETHFSHFDHAHREVFLRLLAAHEDSSVTVGELEASTKVAFSQTL